MPMVLVGRLDSPYVRRVAISLKLLGVPFEHRPVSIFRGFQEFAAINPVVKAPTVITASGVVLLDSTLILQHAEAVSGRTFPINNSVARDKELRVLGLALAACEKTVQIVYETKLRPTEKQHQPWLDRIRGQCLSAYAELETELKAWDAGSTEGTMTQADIASAVAWSFTKYVASECADEKKFPHVASHAQVAERLPVFISTPIE